MGAPKRTLAGYAPDSWQVTCTTAKKMGVTVTVSPAGKGEKGFPANRPDLVKIEQRLKQSFEAKYVSTADISVWVTAASSKKR